MLDLSKIIGIHCHVIQEVDSSWYEERYVSKSLLKFFILLPVQLSLCMVLLAVSKAFLLLINHREHN